MRKRNLSLMSTVLAAALSASMLICAIPVSAADASTVVLNGEEMSLDDLIKNANKKGICSLWECLMTGQTGKVPGMQSQILTESPTAMLI